MWIDSSLKSCYLCLVPHDGDIPVLRSNHAAEINNKGLKRQAAARATHDKDSATDVAVDDGQRKSFFLFVDVADCL